MSLRESITSEHAKGQGASRLTEINNKIGTCMHPFTSVLYDLRSILDDREKTYVEIGSYKGNSASLMLSHPSPTKVFAIDCCTLTFSGKQQSEVIESNVEYICGSSAASNFKLYKGMSGSRDILDQVYRDVGLGQVDILFIDGDHSRAGVVADWNNYYPLVKRGGWVVFDDYSDSVYSPEVKGAVDEIVASCQPGSIEVAGCIDNVNNLTLPPGVRYDNPGIGNDFIIKVL